MNKALDAGALAAAWVEQFNDALSRRDVTTATSLFGEESYWRDIVAFT